jgi:hypothetical protein
MIAVVRPSSPSELTWRSVGLCSSSGYDDEA